MKCLYFDFDINYFVNKLDNIGVDFEFIIIVKWVFINVFIK